MEVKVDSNATDEDFSFATDDPDLKVDPYYQKLLKILCLLENQRIKYVQRIDAICDVSKLLDNESAAVLKMSENGELDEVIPPVEEVEDDVTIDWSKYNMKEDENGNVSLIDNLLQPQTRHKRKEPSSFDDDDNSDSNDKILVRGREFDETKPETFNQLWTEEEQARLEELLVEYPPERIENRRWAKIAKALGNRTPKQVCSRVQKYFLKLRKAGLVVPGRAPRSSAFKKSGKLKKNLHVQTTFFPKLTKESKLKSDCELIMTMNNQSTSKNKFKGVLGFDFLCDEWETEAEDSTNWIDPIAISDDNSLNTENNVDKISDSNNDNSLLMSGNENMRNSETEMVVKELDNVWMTNERKLEILLKIKESMMSPAGSYRHFHFKCHNCGEQPIVGIKWHCSSCDVEFCSDCIFMILDEDEDDVQHPVNHAIFAARVLDSEENGSKKDKIIYCYC
ncbi:ada2a-containing complex component 1 isoform X2 [Lycorma delicatula]|uniref:ada2a-containing complex component 1 isoform X2 n=1 Tax=Lycorma delicatula TaxID=130591 RepID=UPI003F513931